MSSSPGFRRCQASCLIRVLLLRIPLTEHGWAQAWQALVRIDHELSAATIGYVADVVFLGGYAPESDLTVHSGRRWLGGGLPEALQISLSQALSTIRQARATASRPEDGRRPEFLVNQLAKLATMLENGLLTRDEFERMKAAVISAAGS
jgi:Short C-terminal domain